MSYEERNNVVSLVCSLLILAFYLVNLYPMIQDGELVATQVYSLWATTIVLAIVINIAAAILTNIAFAIVHTVATKEDPKFITDERDKLIQLKGTRNAYLIFGLGTFFSMGTLVLNIPPLVMFNLLIFSGIAAEVFGSLSRLYLYRRGV
jgi:hypothetical protein